MASIVRKWQESGEVRLSPVNGGPGLLFHAGGRLRAVMTVATAGEHVAGVYIVVNPEKLGAERPGALRSRLTALTPPAPQPRSIPPGPSLAVKSKQVVHPGPSAG